VALHSPGVVLGLSPADGTSGCALDSALDFFRESTAWYLALAFLSSELYASPSSAAAAGAVLVTPGLALVFEVAPDGSVVFVLPALDRSVDCTRKADAEVDAVLPLAVAARSGDRRAERETWVLPRPCGGDVVGVVAVEGGTKVDADEYTDSQPGSS
jgi:hypothetical protein